MSVVTPACCHTHLAKSAHHASFWFAMLKRASRPQPSALGDCAPTSVLYGSQSTPRKLVAAGVSPTPTWLSAMLAIDPAMALLAPPATVTGEAGGAATHNARSRAARAGAPMRRCRTCRNRFWSSQSGIRSHGTGEELGPGVPLGPAGPVGLAPSVLVACWRPAGPY